MNIEILKNLSDINATATQEMKVNEYIRNEIALYVDEIYYDNFGNLVARKVGKGPKVMLAAHTDQIGFMINDIDDKGMIRYSETGYLLPHNVVGQRVIINDTIMGVIGTDKIDASGIPPTNKERFFIDIGSNSKEETEAKVKVGDFGNFYSEFYHNDKIVMARAMDDRVGCFVLVELIQKLKLSNYDIYFVFTSQEETGLRGAKTAAYSIDAEYGISVDITPTGDLPGEKNSTAMLGKGAGIKLMDSSAIIHPELKKKLVASAEENKIPYQFEVMKRGGTDVGAIHVSRNGVKTAAVSVPTRHGHSANELMAKADIESVINLLFHFLKA